MASCGDAAGGVLDIPEIGDEFEYHCFIAFSFKDEEKADAIQKYLREKNFRVSICKEFPLGNALVDNIENCVKKSRRAVVLMSKNYIESDYYSHETLLFIHNNSTHQRQLIIPVCLDLTAEEMKSSRLGVYSYQYINYAGTEVDQDHYRIAMAVAGGGGTSDLKLMELGSEVPYWNLTPLPQGGECSIWGKTLGRVVVELAVCLPAFGDIPAFGPDIPLRVSLPCGNVAQGLVWSFYYGYLKLILPGLKERCEESEFSKHRHMVSTMFILIPDTGLCHQTITDCDPNITVAGTLAPVIRNRAGVISRPYPTSIYLIKGPDGAEYYAPCEYATPVLSMYEMCQEGLAGLSDDEKKHQIRDFKDLLDQVLSHSSVSGGKRMFKIIYFEADKDGKSNVSHQIVEAIKKLQEDQERDQQYADAQAEQLEKVKL